MPILSNAETEQSQGGGLLQLLLGHALTLSDDLDTVYTASCIRVETSVEMFYL
jgi:hypothetical protein